LEGAGRVLALILGPEVPQPEVRGQARQLEERRAPFAEGHRLLAGGQRQQLPEAVHPGRPALERLLRDGGRDAGQVVADREHLAAGLANGEEPPGLVTLAADGAFDGGHENGWASVVGAWGSEAGRRAPPGRGAAGAPRPALPGRPAIR